MKLEENRACGICGTRDIPFGVDWPYWQAGRPVHAVCAIDRFGVRSVCAAPFAEGESGRIFCELMPEHAGQHEVYRDSTQFALFPASETHRTTEGE